MPDARRRALLLLLTVGAVARAQAPGKVARVGYLGPSAETAPHLVKAFQEGLASLGYVEGRNLVVEYRWTNVGNNMKDEATLVASARELVARNVDVITASIDPAIIAASKVAGNVPIVMLNVSDPVELGLAESLSRPGRNVTGMTRLSPELIGKNLQILLDVLPAAKRVGLLVGAPNGINRAIVRNGQQAAQARGVQLQVVEARSVPELEAAFSALKRGRAEGMLVGNTGDGVFFTQRERIAELALANQLPTVFGNSENAEVGGLIAYSPSATTHYRHAATFVDKILKGTKAGEIPIEQPTKFELVVNLKTAKAMKITVPQWLLLQADRVIE